MPSSRHAALRHKMAACKITFLLIFANVAVYLVAGALDTRAFEDLSHGSFLIDWGGNVPPLTLSGEYWRLFTSMFLHVSFLHLAANMLALWSIGFVLEARMRWPVVLGIYLLSGLCSSLVSTLWNRGELLVTCGASGAILGVFGAALIYALHDRRAGRSHISLRSMVISLVLTFGAGAMLDIDNAAHIGGLISGAVLAGIALTAERLRLATRVMVLTVVAALSAALLTGVTLKNHDSDMQEQLAIARFNKTLGQMGLLNFEMAYSGAVVLDSCIDQTLFEAAEGTSQAQDLRRCVIDDRETQTLLSVFMPLKYRRCHMEVADLLALERDSATQEALRAADSYCEVQTKLYAAIFREAPDDLDLAQASKARLVMKFLMDGSQQYRTDSEALNAQAEAMRRMLDRPGELASAIMSESGCPYWSCAR